jgi:hypothetical protein
MFTFKTICLFSIGGYSQPFMISAGAKHRSGNVL